MDGIIINDEVYKLVEDDKDFDCADCALKEYCDNFGISICTAAFTSNAPKHFEKVEKTSSKNDKQSETSNQSYFY